MLQSITRTHCCYGKVNFSPDSESWLVAVTQTIELWDVNTGQLLQGHTSSVIYPF